MTKEGKLFLDVFPIHSIEKKKKEYISFIRSIFSIRGPYL